MGQPGGVSQLGGVSRGVGQSARGRGQPGGLAGGVSWGSAAGESAKIGQQNEYSLHGGRYASCFHAGGLSCLFVDLFWRVTQIQKTLCISLY